MKNKKIMIIGIITGVLVLLVSVTYALYNYGLFGIKNNQLVLGDIYMHYKENNQLVLTDDDIKDASSTDPYTKSFGYYIPNPIMENQDATDTETELYACINLFENDWGWSVDEDAGETWESYCKGTGTEWGYTFQEDIYYSNEDDINELKALNVIKTNNIEYTHINLNSDIKNQEVEDKKELLSCINLAFSKLYFNDVAKAESFCKGVETYDGLTLQENLDNWASNNTSRFESFTADNIAIQDGEGYIVNPIIQTQERNELMTCIVLFTDWRYGFDEGTTAESFCRGTGTIDGGVTIISEFENSLTDFDYMQYYGYRLLENNIIVPEIIANIPYFEFTISGKNTYSNKDIYYDIILNHGDSHETRTERIRDDLLRFSLVKIVDGEETIMFENMSYDNLNNKNILRETIAKNTMDEVNITYRLYMGFYEGIRVGVVGPNSNQTVDYDFDTWNNEVYGSIKVNVKGGLVD